MFRPGARADDSHDWAYDFAGTPAACVRLPSPRDGDRLDVGPWADAEFAFARGPAIKRVRRPRRHVIDEEQRSSSP